MGLTSRSTPVWVNRLVVEVDRLMGIGHIGPSPYAGYSGGWKLIVPGVAALDTINASHSHVVLGFRQFGRVNVPCRQDLQEAGSLVKMDLVIDDHPCLVLTFKIFYGSLGFFVVGREGCAALFSTNHRNSDRAYEFMLINS